MVVNGNKFTFDGTIEPLDIRHSNLYIGGHEDLYKIVSNIFWFPIFRRLIWPKILQ